MSQKGCKKGVKRVLKVSESDQFWPLLTVYEKVSRTPTYSGIGRSRNVRIVRCVSSQSSRGTGSTVGLGTSVSHDARST